MGEIKTRFALEGESQFRSAMNSAASAIKVLNAEQKLAKASFKQTGDAEKYAATQATILQQKITQQKAAVEAAQKAIKQLNDNGVSQSSKEFQKWQTKLYNAQTALTNMETELQTVNGTMQQTSTTAENTGDAIENIGKKVSFDAVISGIGKITDKMEAAASKARDLAVGISNAMRDAASWADDLATTATVYGFSTDEVQRMRYTADILDTSFESIIKSRQKLVNAMQSDSDVFGELGVQIYEMGMSGKFGKVQGDLRNWEDVFWDLGAALTNIEKTKGFEYVNKQAQQLLGRNWEQLKPIFNSDWASADNYLGRAFDSAREYYEAVMESWNTVSEEDVNKLTKYDDALQKLGNEFQTLQETVLAQLAPGFTEIANTVSGIVAQFNEYLKTEKGKEMLQGLSDAVVSLFQGLSNVDFGTVLQIATDAINGLTTGLEWIKNNWETVKVAIESLAIAFGLLKVSETVLTFMQMLASGKYLFSNGQITGYNSGANAPTSAPTTTTPSGTSGLGDTAKFLVAKVLPWAIGAGIVVADSLNNHGNDDLYDKNGNLTETGQMYGFTQEDAQETQNAVNEYRASKEAVMEATGLSEKQLSMLQGFWSTYKEVAEKGQQAGGDMVQRYNEYGQKLPEMFEGQEKQLAMYMKKIQELYESGERGNKLDWSFFNIDSEGVEIPVMPLAPDDAAGLISSQIGTVPVNVTPVLYNAAAGLSGILSGLRGFANGIQSVPYDGMLALLHKGERVVPAREVASRSFSSNLYVENMNMGGGVTADALAAAIAGRNRRMMAGYGS